MTEWIKWEGGTCPVPDGTVVDLQYRNGRMMYAIPARQAHGAGAGAAYWHHDGCNQDIIAYRLSKSVPEDINRGESVKSNQTCTLDVVNTWPPDQRIGAYRHTVLKYLMNLDSEDMSAQEIAEGICCMEKLLEMLKGNE